MWIHGVVLRDGRLDTGTPYGGAIYIENGTLLLTQVTIRNNVAFREVAPGFTLGFGGGIYSDRSSVELRDCELFQNVSVSGSGITTQDGTLKILRTTLRNNVGATLSARDKGTIDVLDSNITDNNGLGIGGTGAFRVKRSTIARNMGPGLMLTSGTDTLALVDSKILDNQNVSGLGSSSEMIVRQPLRNGESGVLFLNSHAWIQDNSLHPRPHPKSLIEAKVDIVEA